MLKGIDPFGCCNIVIKILNLQKIEDCYKTPIQPTTAKLNTADDSPMSALGMTALHLRIAEFKFTHNFIICNQLPETELFLELTYKGSFLSPMLGTRNKTVTFKGKENF